MFLRPTESPIVFLQQLGRGLRRSKGKEYLNVLDFIGNYEKAGRVRYLLTGKNKEEKQNYSPADKTDYPDDCFVDFDMKLIDLFAEMDKKQQSLKDQIKKEYFRIKELLGRQHPEWTYLHIWTMTFIRRQLHVQAKIHLKSIWNI